MKISVIYWSGTGNTEKMAEYVGLTGAADAEGSVLHTEA